MIYNINIKQFQKYHIPFFIIFILCIYIYINWYLNIYDNHFSEKNNQNIEYLIITPITNHTSNKFLKEIYNIENRIYICEKSTNNSLCSYRLKKDYGYKNLTYMMIDIYKNLLVDYPNVKMFYKMDDDTLVEKSYLLEFINVHINMTNNNKNIYFGYPEICPGKRKDKSKPCKQGRLYGMSRDVLNNSVNSDELVIENFYYRIEDCFMCDIIWSYSDNNLLSIDANKNKVYHKKFQDKSIFINMSFISNH